MRLAQADLKAILGVLADLDAQPADGAYGPEVAEAISRLVPCDDVFHQRVDLDARQFLEPDPADLDDDDLYWSVGPCPITGYRVRTGDMSAMRMSDVISRGRYHQLPIYRDYFRPGGVDHVLDLGLSTTPSAFRSVVLFRGGDVVDFSERERTMLELLRPHLRAREARAALLALLVDGSPDAGRREDAEASHLTVREREIVVKVAQGKTNAEIAAELWVSPATVKKHLENVYLKLGVGSRAAAASRLLGPTFAN